jgi:hypothetical protein
MQFIKCLRYERPTFNCLLFVVSSFMQLVCSLKPLTDLRLIPGRRAQAASAADPLLAVIQYICGIFIGSVTECRLADT